MKLLLSVSLLMTSALHVFACCMLPEKYQGSISQRSQEALIIHSQGQEELILKVSPELQGIGAAPYFTWIIPVPNKPTNYKTIDSKIFEDVYGFAQKTLSPPSRGDSFGDDGFGDAMPASLGLSIDKPVKVGPYDIQPIQAEGEEGLKALNEWLSTNGFPTESDEHMAYFVENNFTFLCVKVVPGTDPLKGATDLTPLQISFPTETLYYPLMYSSQQGEFSLQLYTMTDKRIDYHSNHELLDKMNWKFSGLKKNLPFIKTHKQLPESISKLIPTEDTLYFNSVIANPNKEKALEQWEADCFIETKMNAAQVKHWFDGFHDAEHFGKAFGQPNKITKDSRGKMTITYQLDGGETLYMKKDTRQFQALIMDDKKKKHLLPSMYTTTKLLNYSINSALPRGRDGKIFFPDDITPDTLSEKALACCTDYLKKAHKDAELTFVAGKTFTRILCLKFKQDEKLHSLIYDTVRNEVLGPYDEIDK